MPHTRSVKVFFAPSAAAASRACRLSAARRAQEAPGSSARRRLRRAGRRIAPGSTGCPRAETDPGAARTNPREYPPAGRPRAEARSVADGQSGSTWRRIRCWRRSSGNTRRSCTIPATSWKTSTRRTASYNDPKRRERQEMLGVLAGVAAFIAFLVIIGLVVWVIR